GEAKDLGSMVSAALAAAAINPVIGDFRARVHVNGPRVLPLLRPAIGIEAVEPVVPCAEEHPSAGDGGTRLNVPCHRKGPAFLPRGGVHAIKLAVKILVHPLTYIQGAVC